MNDNKRRIVLIGFRGCGKSTIGRKLAERLKWNYISTDKRIEEKEGIVINQIVEKKGWNYFRKLESEILRELEPLQYSVIDTGGGTIIEHEKEIDILLNSSIVIWIDASLEDILDRLKADEDRPLLNQKNPVEDITFNYKKRRPIYQRLAKRRFNSSRESAEEICNEIISILRS